jgi:hypothetical protein
MDAVEGVACVEERLCRVTNGVVGVTCDGDGEPPNESHEQGLRVAPHHDRDWDKLHVGSVHLHAGKVIPGGEWREERNPVTRSCQGFESVPDNEPPSVPGRPGALGAEPEDAHAPIIDERPLG